MCGVAFWTALHMLSSNAWLMQSRLGSDAGLRTGPLGAFFWGPILEIVPLGAFFCGPILEIVPLGAFLWGTILEIVNVSLTKECFILVRR